jgi:hypothetical protein
LKKKVLACLLDGFASRSRNLAKGYRRQTRRPSVRRAGQDAI